MKYCSKCGTQSEDDAKICSNCGTSFYDAGSKKKPKRKKKSVLLSVIVGILAIVGLGTVLVSCHKSSTKSEPWPDTPLAAKIPSRDWKVEYASDSGKSLSIKISEGLSGKLYTEYIKDAKDMGYNVDVVEDGSNFEAKNSEGWTLKLSYSKFSSGETMYIDLEAPKDESADQATTDSSSDSAATDTSSSSTSDSAAASTDSDGVSPDFKELMDGYETYMNNYVDFMKKYDANPNDPTLIADYASMMSDYANWTKKFEDVDESTLSAADDAYYLEVQSRVLKRLSEIQ